MHKAPFFVILGNCSPAPTRTLKGSPDSPSRTDPRLCSENEPHQLQYAPVCELRGRESPDAGWKAAVACTGCRLCGSWDCAVRVAGSLFTHCKVSSGACSSTWDLIRGIQVSVEQPPSGGAERGKWDGLLIHFPQGTKASIRDHRLMEGSVSKDTGHKDDDYKLELSSIEGHLAGAMGTSEARHLGGKADSGITPEFDPSSPLPNCPSLASD